MSDLFGRALEGEKLTAEEIAQMWREAPVTRVSTEEYEWLVALLDEPPQVVPELLEAAKRVYKRTDS